MPTYPYGQVVEMGKAGNGMAGPGTWETNPGSATAYEGSDDENSPPSNWTIDPNATVSLDHPEATDADLFGEWMEDWNDELKDRLDGSLDPARPQDNVAESEPCGLTVAEWRAHQAQMAADVAAAKKQKTLHMVLAAVGGYLISNWMK